MSRGTFVVALVHAVACSPGHDSTLIIGATATTYLVFSLGEHDSVLEMHALEVSSPALDLAASSDTHFRVLEYDASIETLRLDVDATGRVAVLPNSAPSEEAWPVPSPKAWSDLVGAGDTFVPGKTDLGPWIKTFRVARPPCRSLPSVRPVVGLSDIQGVSFALATARELVLGSYSKSLVYRVPFDGELASVDGAFESRAVLPRSRAYVDEGQAWVVWAETGTIATRHVYELRPVGGGRDPVRTELGPGLRDLSLERVVAARSGGELILIGRGVIMGSAPTEEHLVRLDAGLVWRSIARSPLDLAKSCPGRFGTLVLSVAEDGSGAAGITAGPLTSFQLDPTFALGAPLVDQRVMCRNAITTTGSGIEVLVFSSAENRAGISSVFLAWRPIGGSWEIVAADNLDSKTVTSIEDRILASGPGGVVVIYEIEPSRPELPPRLCHRVATDVNIYHLVPMGAGRVFVGGHDTHPVILDFGI